MLSPQSVTNSSFGRTYLAAHRRFSFSRKGLSAMEGLRAAAAITAVVSASEMFHRPDFLWAGIAAFWTCLVDPGGAFKTRVAAIVSFVLLGSLTCFVAASTHRYGPSVALPLAALWIFCGGMASSFGSAWAQVGSLNTVVFIVAGIRPTIDGRFGMSALFLAGGLWAAVLTLAIWRIHPYLPLRRAVAEAFQSLGLLAADLHRLVRLDEYQEQSWSAHAKLHRQESRAAIDTARAAVVNTPRLSGMSSLEGDRLRLLVEIADQIFGQFVALSELLELYRERQSAPFPDDLSRSLRRLSTGLTGLASALPASGAARDRRLQRSSLLINSSSPPARDPESGASPLGDIRRILTALSDRLKVVATLEMEDSGTAPLPQPPPPLIDVDRPGVWQSLLENLTFTSTTLQHALRASVVGTIAVGLVLVYHLPYGYWLAMTTVLVLQPFIASTWPRAAERVLGSALGGALAALVGLAIHSPIERVALISLLSFVTMSVRPIGYPLFIFFLTPLFVTVADLGYPGSHAIVFAKWRVFNTLLGSLLALLGGLVFWPTWEIGRFPRELGKAIDANTAYAVAVLSHLNTERSERVRSEIKSKRREAGLASNTAEASLRRLLMEPRAQKLIDSNAATAVLAAVRRMGGTAAALYLGETGKAAHSDTLISSETTWLASAGAATADAAMQKRCPPELPPIDLPRSADNTTDLPVRIARQMQVIHSAVAHLFPETTANC